jgi:hypothetical protein
MSRRRASAPPVAPEVLVCPRCGDRYPAEPRFCSRCHLPLVQLDPPAALREDVAGRHERARKVKPQLAEGELLKVARGRNQAEGEFIQGLLLEEGVPSLLRRSAGFDVPDFLAAGPRDVLVPASGVPVAREVLLQADIVSGEPAGRVVSPGRLLAGLLLALALGALIVWLMALAVHS